MSATEGLQRVAPDVRMKQPLQHWGEDAEIDDGGCVLALAGIASRLAASTWQRVVLEQNISVEVPTSVGYELDPAKTDPGHYLDRLHAIRERPQQCQRLPRSPELFRRRHTRGGD